MGSSPMRIATRSTSIDETFSRRAKAAGLLPGSEIEGIRGSSRWFCSPQPDLRPPPGPPPGVGQGPDHALQLAGHAPPVVQPLHPRTGPPPKRRPMSRASRPCEPLNVDWTSDAGQNTTRTHLAIGKQNPAASAAHLNPTGRPAAQNESSKTRPVARNAPNGATTKAQTLVGAG